MLRRASSSFVASLVLACAPPEVATDDIDTDTAAPPDPRIAALRADPSVCGAPSYAWIDDPALGEVLEHEPATLGEITAQGIVALIESAAEATLDVPVEHDVAIWRYRYRTQDRGQWTEATSMVAVPTTPGGSFPVLLSPHGTSGFSDGCSPSATLEGALAAALVASMGFVVVVPDFLGMRSMGPPSDAVHPYVVAEPTAIASLDALRGARELLAGPVGAGIDVPEGRVLLIGGSQGGHGVLAISRYAPYYLGPGEEEIVAIATSVPVSDLVGQTQYWSGVHGLGTENVVAVLSAASDWYGADLSTMLQAPLDVDVPEQMAENCSLSGLLGATTSTDEVFTAAYRADAEAGFPEDGTVASCLLRENSLVHTSVEPLIRPPTMWVLGEGDTLLYNPAERAAFDTFCERGEQMVYTECEGAEHTEAAAATLLDQLDFLRARWAGEALDPEAVCERTAAVACEVPLVP